MVALTKWSDRSVQRVAAKHQVVIIGGGTAGLTVAARLRRARPALDVAIVEPSDKHYYQPLWTLVGAGVGTKEDTVRAEADYIPAGTTWLRDAAEGFDPEHNRVFLRGGGILTYDFLVVAPGIQLNWGAVKGLPETLGQNGVSSNYAYELVDKTWEFLRAVKEGNALFTMPSTPIKCGGAPQKIMYLAEHFFRKQGIRDQVQVHFYSAGKAIFGVQKYRDTLERIVKERDIRTHFRQELVEVRGAAREAVFRDLDNGAESVVPYSFLHVVPPQGPPDFIRQSPLAVEGGWAGADKHTLRHPKYGNVFSLGDASALPASRTGAAVRKQAPVLVENLLAVLDGQEPRASYDGYASCPLITGYGRLVLAEFDYDGKPAETFPFNQAKERRSMYELKRHGLPLLYWHGMLRGRA